MSEHTFETAALKAVTIDAVKYNEEGLRNSITPETIQSVAPLRWWDTHGGFSYGYNVPAVLGAIIIGNSSSNQYGVVLGHQAYSAYTGVAVGCNANSTKTSAIAIGFRNSAQKELSITVGSKIEDASGNYECTTEGTGSITIGAGANTKNNGDIESSNSVTIGCKANTTAPDSITLGAGASNTNSGSILIGSAAKSEGDKALTITLGSQFTETTDTGDITHPCSTEGTGSITIGAGANTLNNGDVESSNSVTIGCKASNSGADSVVIGASATSAQDSNVIIGAGINITSGRNLVALGRNIKNINKNNCDYSVSAGTNVVPSSFGVGVGHGTTFKKHAVALGYSSKANAENTIAIGSNAAITDTGSTLSKNTAVIGYGATASVPNAVVLGANAKVADLGATVIRSTAEDGTYTQLYFSGANTPLANEFEDGEAMMGYVVRDSAGNVMMDAEGNALVGTQKLSVLFPNNRGENAFTPAALNLDEGWTPKPMFRPSDLDLPIEEPEVEEPENIEPAKPLVYKPQPVYPIVEPEIEEINE